MKNRRLTSFPGFSRYQIPDLPEGVVTGDLDSPVATMLQKMGQKLPKAAAVVMNSFDDLAPEIDNVLNVEVFGFGSARWVPL